MLLTEVIDGTWQTIAGTVSGTIVVLSVVTAAETLEHDLWRLAVIASAAVVIYWIAHVSSASVVRPDGAIHPKRVMTPAGG